MRAAATSPKPDRVRRSTLTPRVIRPVTGKPQRTQVKNETPPRVRILRSIASTLPHLDRVDFTVRYYRREDHARLEKLHGRRVAKKTRSITTTVQGKKRTFKQHRFILGQPQLKTLEFADEMMRSGEGWLTYVEAAYDMVTEFSADEMDRWLRDHVIIRNRRRGPIGISNLTTAYFAGTPAENENSYPPHNLVLYPTLPPKTKPGANAPGAKLEHRFNGAPSIGNSQGDEAPIKTMADLMAADPAAMFYANCYLTNFDAAAWRENYLRDEIAKYRRAYLRNGARMSTDAIKRRVEREMRVIHQYDFVQRIKERNPHLNMPRVEGLITIPQQWTWGARKPSLTP